MAYIDILNSSDDGGCKVCGSKSIFNEETNEFLCSVCGKVKKQGESCNNDHHVCENCRVSSNYEIISSICLDSKQKDPLALAVEIMNSSAIKNQGAEHHFIVPAVLMTCIHNANGKPENLVATLKKAEKLAAETPVSCTFSEGTCGAAIGTGIFMSIFTDRDEIVEEEFSLSDSVTAETLQTIEKTHGPRCCKRDTYISIEQTVNFLRDKFAIDLPMSEARCTFSLRNESCGHEECGYYNIAYSLV